MFEPSWEFGERRTTRHGEREQEAGQGLAEAKLGRTFRCLIFLIFAMNRRGDRPCTFFKICGFSEKRLHHPIPSRFKNAQGNNKKKRTAYILLLNPWLCHIKGTFWADFIDFFEREISKLDDAGEWDNYQVICPIWRRNQHSDLGSWSDFSEIEDFDRTFNAQTSSKV